VYERQKRKRAKSRQKGEREMKLTFDVIGLPKPQARPRVFKRGNFAGAYSPTTEWKESVKYAASQHKPFDDLPLAMRVVFFYDRPKSHYGTGKNADKLKESAPKYHTKRPDVDNLAKAILDAIQDAGLIKDDSAIVMLDVAKYYVGKDSEIKQGCKITITSEMV
jgi:Holliday junction resolvase RusA-like endonuclease